MSRSSTRFDPVIDELSPLDLRMIFEPGGADIIRSLRVPLLYSTPKRSLEGIPECPTGALDILSGRRNPWTPPVQVRNVLARRKPRLLFLLPGSL